MRRTIWHFGNFADRDIREKIKSIIFMEKRSAFPVTPVATMFEWKEPESLYSIRGTNGNENAHLYSIRKGDRVLRPNYLSIILIYGVKENMRCCRNIT